ncbi:hypothetical protein [Rubritepida flocculans]|uniref:hypothetical protein n=1 Tax=Rubritepida flocculans TaxID=182403 RepID=UPI0012EB9F3D|nr:hypothetical protein [Rubritepida flocculans]
MGLAMLAVAPLGCAPTPEQQGAAIARAEPLQAARARETRRFDTANFGLVLQAALGALQDTGFTIEETQADAGLITAVKLGDARIRVQVSVRRIPGREATLARVTFQRVVPRPGAMLAMGEVLDDPLLYRDFFERMSQSLFLTANEI